MRKGYKLRHELVAAEEALVSAQKALDEYNRNVALVLRENHPVHPRFRCGAGYTLTVSLTGDGFVDISEHVRAWEDSRYETGPFGVEGSMVPGYWYDFCTGKIRLPQAVYDEGAEAVERWCRAERVKVLEARKQRLDAALDAARGEEAS